jgi:hypothetical protein
MDAVGTIVIAVGAFALLQVVAVHLRGEERHARRTRAGHLHRSSREARS